MLEYASRIKQKMLEFTRLFCLETSIFQRFVIIYKYIYFLNSDPVAKNILQSIFDDTSKALGQYGDQHFDEEEFLNIKGDVLFSREFWMYYSNLELIHKKMKKLKNTCLANKEEFDNFCLLFSKPYSKGMLELSFQVINSEVFERLDKECFFNGGEDEHKTSFDEQKSVLYVKGLKVPINRKSKITNDHKILRHIFISNKENVRDDFFYSEIAEDEFQELDYKNRKNNWRKYHHACEMVNTKVKKESKDQVHDFLIFNTGVQGSVKINAKYL